MTQIVIYRDRMVGNWMATYKGNTTADDVTHATRYSTAERAGNVAAAIAQANPGSQIGVKSCELGLATAVAFGPIVWLRDGFAA